MDHDRVGLHRQEYKSRRNWNSFDVQRLMITNAGSCASTLRQPALLDSKIDKSGFQQWRSHLVRVTALDEVAQDVIGLHGSAPLCKSRYIEDVNEDPGLVIAAAFRERKSSDGLWPQAVAIAFDSSSILMDSSAPPETATISPIVPRIRQVMAPRVASWIHFSHISCMMSVDKRASNPAPCSVASSVFSRGVL